MIRRIDVTADDIAKGARAESRTCPVALAVRRVIGDRYNRICVGIVDLCLGHDAYVLHVLPLPVEVRVFVRHFDDVQDESVRPFSFAIDIP